MPSSGAGAAFRGYRLQTLFALSRLIQDQSLAYHPEGIEDLDILSQTGELLETIQVKAYKSSLSLSDFSPQNKDSFFRRALDTRNKHPNAEVAVVSYGPIGQELALAWAGDGPERDTVVKKLVSHGYHPEEIAVIFTISLMTVDEHTLVQKVNDFLSQTLAGGDPPTAFDLLLYWIYLASETSEKFTHTSLTAKLTQVGRYLHERNAHYDEWFTTIHPLSDEDITKSAASRLKEEYFQGIDARYQHVLADLDVVRNEKLEEIQRKFQHRNVVIIHGASGQGKSTLAFRFLHDFVPNHWRLWVRVLEDRKHVLKIASVVAAHAKAVGLPLTVYLDISPKDRDWPELVRELSILEHLRILVTIREEDWRQTARFMTRFLFEHLELQFDRNEAQRLFERIQHLDGRFLYFEDAWREFRAQGPLLEFVYLVTQNQSLFSRIEEQIAQLQDRVRTGDLQDNELHMLRLIAVASAYEARSSISKLAQYLGLREVQRTIKLFEREYYLIQVNPDNNTVSGLHSIRSNIMLGCLLDNITHSWESAAKECLSFILDTDIEVFLMYTFSRRRDQSGNLVQSLAAFVPGSWKGIAGVLRSLLWLGVRDYTEANRSLIDQEIAKKGSGWYFTLDFDVAGIAGRTVSRWWESVPFLSSEIVQHIENVQKQQKPKALAFSYAIAWLTELEPLGHLPVDTLDWAGYAEVLFWSNHLKIEKVTKSILGQLDFGKALSDLTIDSFGDLVYSSHYALGDKFVEEYQKCRTEVESRFKAATRTFYLEDDGSTIRSHFIPDFVLEHDGENEVPRAQQFLPHAEAMSRIDLMRKLFPDRERFGSQGYGHRLGSLSPESDETDKPGVKSELFYPVWAQRINTHFRFLGDYPHRIGTWPEYATLIMHLRRDTVDCLAQLQKALDTYFRKEKYEALIGRHLDSGLWGRCIEVTENPPLLPKGAVDEWGFTGDVIRGEYTDTKPLTVLSAARHFYAPAQYATYVEVKTEYLRSLSNFFSQGIHVIARNSVSGRTPANRSTEMEQIFNEKGIRSGQEILATGNLHSAFKILPQFQRQFRSQLGRLVASDDLSRLEERENRLAHELMSVWYQFAFHPRRRSMSATKEFTKELDDTLRRMPRQIGQSLKKLRREPSTSFAAYVRYLRYEGSDLPCIVLDVQDPTLLWEIVESAIQLVQEAIHTESNTSLWHFTTQHWIRNIAVLPLIQGKALTQSLFIIPTFALRSGTAHTKWYYFTPKTLTDENWTKLSVAVWDRTMFEPAITFAENVAALSILALQAGDLARFSGEVDDANIGIVQSFLEHHGDRLSTYLQNVLDAFVAINRHYGLQGAELEKRPYLRDAISLAVDICRDVLPTYEADNAMKVKVETIREWAEKLEQKRTQAEFFKLLWIADILRTDDK